MGRLFGTDGVRGIANSELTPELAFNLGRAGSYVLTREHARPRILIGKDTRISGDMLEAALVAGMCSLGAQVYRLGVVPTPAVAYLTTKYQAAAGVVISASHNPVEYNGIKFFAGSGFKLPDETEDEIESLLPRVADLPRPEGAAVGQVVEAGQAAADYLDHLVSCYQAERDCRGLTIALDCANGAASQLAPALWQRLGARVIPVCNQPDGTNINEKCGSTHPEVVQQAVIDHHADIGIAHDGDADRVIVVDEKGQILDGDHIMALGALHLQKTGRLNPARIVSTVISNIASIWPWPTAGSPSTTARPTTVMYWKPCSRTGLVWGASSRCTLFPSTMPPRETVRQFLLRGLEKVRPYWRFVCGVQNLFKLFRAGIRYQMA